MKTKIDRLPIQTKIAHAVVDHYREQGYSIFGPYTNPGCVEVMLPVKWRPGTTFCLQLIFYDDCAVFVPGGRRRQRRYEYANPNMFPRLDKLFKLIPTAIQLYG